MSGGTGTPASGLAAIGAPLVNGINGANTFPAPPAPVSGAGGVQPAVSPLSGKGGVGGVKPDGGKGGVGGTQPVAPPVAPPVAAPVAPPPQYAPVPPQNQFNVNQASAGALQQSLGATQQGLGFTPQGISAQTYTPAQIAGTDLTPYTNPYESQVVEQTLSDLERSRQMQQNLTGAQATQARAFGGSRQGIAESETNRAFAEQAARAASGLRQQGYQSALGLAGQDVGAQTAAQQYAAQQRASAQAQNLAAQQAAAGTRLGAASQLGQLSQQAFGVGQNIQQNQQRQGLLQQGIQQALIDAAKQQYAGYTGAPMQSLSAPLAALGATPNQSTTTNTKNAGLFDYLSLGATVAASDARLKTDVILAGKIGEVNFYNWKWNDKGKRIADPKQPTFGVMADEIQKTHPHLVKRGNDGYLRVNYRDLISELEAA